MTEPGDVYFDIVHGMPVPAPLAERLAQPD
jgi:hypothetical protein